MQCAHLVTFLRGYWAQYPYAADAADGIAQFWVTPICGFVSEQEVERALDMLQQDRTIDRHRLPDGTWVYRLSHSDSPGSPIEGN